MKSVIAASALVLCAMIGVLFAPRVPRGQEDANCVSVMDFGPAHIHKNCDSEEFQYVAAHPSLLISARRGRQDRPVYALLGWAFARPFHLLGLESVGRSVIAGAKQTYPKGPSPGAYFPEYAGFVVLNFVLLVIAVVVFERTSGARWMLDPLTILPLSMMIVNEVTKAAFWTPHLQMFNIVIPISSVALYRWMIDENQALTWRRTFTLGLAIGFGALAYGAFAVMVSGAALCILIGNGVATLRKELRTRVLKSCLLMIAFFIPTVAWTQLIIYRTGSFYSQEMDLMRQFVWMGDALQSGGISKLLTAFAVKTRGYADTLYAVVLLGVVAVAALWAFLAFRNGTDQAKRANQSLLRAIGLYAIANLLFFWLMGYYQTRLTWSLVPAIALLMTVELRSIDLVLANQGKRILRIASVFATLLYLGYWYVRPGPWS